MDERVPMLPRSFLYVPGSQPTLFAKASAGPADAIVLDLEDAVPVLDKGGARDNVSDWLARHHSEPHGGAGQCWVRVNAESIQADLDAVMRPGLDGIFLAKCTPDSLEAACAALDSLEPRRGLPVGSVRLVGLVESADALLALGTMAHEPRLTTFGIGEVDLLADVRISRDAATAVDLLRTQVVLQCAAARLLPPIAPTSTAFRDLDAFRASTRQMLALGFRSRTAIHPNQVPVIHEVFTPSQADVDAAMDVIARFQHARGGVATDATGRLIDAAVVRSARETVSRRPQL